MAAREGPPPALRALGQAGLLAAALLFVVLVTYLPHMQTLEGRVNPTGAVEEASTENPWTRFGSAYVALANGTKDDYEYPMHVDADVHWVRMAATQRADSLRYPNPFTGEPAGEDTPFSLKGLIHERGFVLAFAQFQEFTGIPFILLIRFGPALFAAVTAWIVWAALRPWPGAALAAAFVALVPSSPRFLGIAFFVPIGIGLAWIATALVMARYAAGDRRVLFLALLLGSWAFFIHLIAGFAFLLAFVAALPAVAKRLRRDLLAFGLFIVLPLVWFFGAFRSDFDREAEVLGFLPTDFTIFDQLGIPFLIAWVLGCGLVVLRPPQGEERFALYAATIASVVAFGFIIVNRVFDLDLYSLYDRWHQPMALFAAVPAAYAVVEVARAARRGLVVLVEPMKNGPRIGGFLQKSTLVSVVAVLLVGVAGGAVATPGMEAHLNEPYYYFMTDQAWAVMQANKDLPPEYDVFLTEPWQAPIFNALSGKRPFTWLDPGEAPHRGQEYVDYHTGQYANDVWLVERGITILLEVPGPGARHYEPGPGGSAVLTRPYVEELAAMRTAG